MNKVILFLKNSFISILPFLKKNGLKLIGLILIISLGYFFYDQINTRFFNKPKQTQEIENTLPAVDYSGDIDRLEQIRCVMKKVPLEVKQSCGLD